jgi:hypothetical protein
MIRMRRRERLPPREALTKAFCVRVDDTRNVRRCSARGAYFDPSRRSSIQPSGYVSLETRSGGALNVSPHNAHRQRVSFVISFASVPTLVDPHEEHVGRFRSSVGIGNAMQPPNLQ